MAVRETWPSLADVSDHGGFGEGGDALTTGSTCTNGAAGGRDGQSGAAGGAGGSDGFYGGGGGTSAPLSVRV